MYSLIIVVEHQISCALKRSVWSKRRRAQLTRQRTATASGAQWSRVQVVRPFDRLAYVSHETWCKRSCSDLDVLGNHPLHLTDLSAYPQLRITDGEKYYSFKLNRTIFLRTHADLEIRFVGIVRGV